MSNIFPLSLPLLFPLPLQFLAVIILAIYLLYTLISFLLTPRPLAGIPHSPLKPLGDLPAFVSYLHKHGRLSPFFLAHAERYGPVSQVLLGPGTTGVILADMHTAQELWHRNEFVRDDFTQRVFSFIPTSVIARPSDARHRYVKRHHTALLLNNAFLERMTPRIQRSAQLLQQLWLERARIANGLPFNAMRDCILVIEDYATGITLGSSFDALPMMLSTVSEGTMKKAVGGGGVIEPSEAIPEISTAHEVLAKAFGAGSGADFPRIYHWWVRRTKKWRDARRVFEDDVRKRLAWTRAAEKGDSLVKDVLDRMTEAPMADDELMDNIMNQIHASTQTSSAALGWAFKHLSRSAQHASRIRAEVSDLPELLSLSDLHPTRVPFLTAFIREVLRVHPAAEVVSRMATKDTTLRGHFIPKGTWILVPLNGVAADFTAAYSAPEALQRSKVPVWRDASRFEPERWLDETGKFCSLAGPFMPFTGGHRGCPGYVMAEFSLRMIVATLVRTFDFEPVATKWDCDNTRPVEALSARPVTCYVNLHIRTSGNDQEC